MLCLARNAVIARASCWLATMVFLAPSATLAEPIFFGPTPYLSAADSPFDLSGLGTTMFLEDFEDGELNTPGILTTSLRPFSPNPPFEVVDSVDADDGMIDGSGLEGHSARASDGICTDSDPGNCWTTGGVSFDRDELGWLPTAVGIVWTDGSPMDGVTFAYTDSTGRNVFRGEQFFLGDDSFMGETGEDRFFGVVDPVGIAGFYLEAGGLSADEPGFDFEVDHLQYGLFVPEPALGALGIFGIVGLWLFSARKTRQSVQRSTR